jgi:hypothetical protein
MCRGQSAALFRRTSQRMPGSGHLIGDGGGLECKVWTVFGHAW